MPCLSTQCDHSHELQRNHNFSYVWNTFYSSKSKVADRSSLLEKRNRLLESTCTLPITHSYRNERITRHFLANINESYYKWRNTPIPSVYSNFYRLYIALYRRAVLCLLEGSHGINETTNIAYNGTILTWVIDDTATRARAGY